MVIGQWVDWSIGPLVDRLPGCPKEGLTDGDAVRTSGRAGARMNCPNCRAPIAANAVICQACGADIALMTLVIESSLAETALSGPDTTRPVSPEQLAPRLGDYLVQHGYVSGDQLRAAL